MSKSIIETLEEAYAQRDATILKKNEIIKSIIPAEIQSKLDEVEIEFKNTLDNINDVISQLEEMVKNQAVEESKTIVASSFQVVYSRGGFSVSAKDVQRVIDRWEKVNPEVVAELRSIMTVKKSSASIRAKS